MMPRYSLPTAWNDRRISGAAVLGLQHDTPPSGELGDIREIAEFSGCFDDLPPVPTSPVGQVARRAIVTEYVPSVGTSDRLAE